MSPASFEVLSTRGAMMRPPSRRGGLCGVLRGGGQRRTGGGARRPCYVQDVQLEHASER